MEKNTYKPKTKLNVVKHEPEFPTCPSLTSVIEPPNPPSPSLTSPPWASLLHPLRLQPQGLFASKHLSFIPSSIFFSAASSSYPALWSRTSCRTCPAHPGLDGHLVLAGGPHVAVHLFLLVLDLPIIIFFRINFCWCQGTSLPLAQSS